MGRSRELLTPVTVVVIPLGAALKSTDRTCACGTTSHSREYLTGRVEAACAGRHHSTAHLPLLSGLSGLSGLHLSDARDRARLHGADRPQPCAHGPKRFYVLNTGISTARALEPAAAVLAQEGILLRYTDFGAAADRLAASVRQQDRVARRRIETSMMLYIDRQLGGYAAGGEGHRTGVHAVQAQSAARWNGNTLAIRRLG